MWDEMSNVQVSGQSCYYCKMPRKCETDARLSLGFDYFSFFIFHEASSSRTQMLAKLDNPRLQQKEKQSIRQPSKEHIPSI